MQSSFVSSPEDDDENCTCPQASHCQALEWIIIDAIPRVPVHIVADPAEEIAEDTKSD